MIPNSDHWLRDQSYLPARSVVFRIGIDALNWHEALALTQPAENCWLDTYFAKSVIVSLARAAQG